MFANKFNLSMSGVETEHMDRWRFSKISRLPFVNLNDIVDG